MMTDGPISCQGKKIQEKVGGILCQDTTQLETDLIVEIHRILIESNRKLTGISKLGKYGQSEENGKET